MGIVLWLLSFPAFCLAQSGDYIPSIQSGKKLYEDHCSVCHGVYGDGKTAMAKMLKKAPISFLDPKIEESFTPQYAYDAITQGREEFGMRAFADISQKGRWDISAYVFTFRENHLELLDPRPELTWGESRQMSDSHIMELFRKRGLPKEKITEQLIIIRKYPQ